MKYAYPQLATRAIDAIRRKDERSDSSGREQQLDQRQELATIGETVPLIFCKRFDWGSGVGVAGGVWLSPHLLQIGIDGKQASLMYLLSQGRLAPIETDGVYWGYQLLTDVDPAAQVCTSYEQVPSCISLDYVPGGTTSWQEVVRLPGPSGNGNFTTPKNTTFISINFDAQVFQEGSATTRGGYAGTFTINKYPSKDANPDAAPNTGVWGPGEGLDPGYNSSRYEFCKIGCKPINTTTYHGSTASPSYSYFWSFADLHTSSQWYLYTRTQFDYEIIDVQTDVKITSGTMIIKDDRTGASNVLQRTVPAGQYRVIFKNQKHFNTKELKRATYVDPGGNPDDVKSEWNRYNGSSYDPKESGYVDQSYAGFSVTSNISSVASCTVTQTLEYPDLPPGGVAGEGALIDLSVMGINANILALRPVEERDYFTQTHLLVKDGIEVERLIEGGTGASSDYADLAYYLMQQSQVIAEDQINKSSLVAAAQMCRKYRLYFNGILQTTNNLSEWLTRTAPYFLLDPTQIDGQYSFSPVSPINSGYTLSQDAIVPSLVITKDQVIEDTYRREYIASRDRRPICMVMVYRSQPEDGLGQTATVEVRYRGSALAGPFEQHDLSEFCVHPEAAVTAARYLLAKRRFTTHTCSMSLTRDGKDLHPGDIVQVNMNTTTTEGAGLNDSFFYKIDTVSEGLEGSVDLSMTHFPTDSANKSMIALEVAGSDITVQ